MGGYGRKPVNATLSLPAKLLGECLVQAMSAVGAKVEIANCETGGTTMQWSVNGGKLRSGSLCAAIATTTPGIVLRRCAPREGQTCRSDRP